MRLAILAPHFPEYVLRYAAAMAAFCEVLVILDRDQLADEFSGRAIPSADCLVVRPLAFKTPLDLLRMLVAIARFRPTIVHLQEAAGPRRALFNAVVMHLFKRTVPVALTIHDPLPHAGNDTAIARRSALLRNHARRHADTAILHGAFCASQYRATSPPPLQRIVVSDHGTILEPQILTPVESGTLALLCFGRMEAYKGVEVLLEAAEQLARDDCNFNLTIAGKGSELDRLAARYARLPQVTIRRDYIPPTQLIDLIQQCEVVVMPYLSATQSGVLAAAFGGGRPVIASRTGGLTDLVADGDNGLLVPPGDAAALAACIAALATDAKLRLRLQEGAAAMAAARLNWHHIARTLHDLFRSGDTTPAGLSEPL